MTQRLNAAWTTCASGTWFLPTMTGMTWKASWKTCSGMCEESATSRATSETFTPNQLVFRDPTPCQCCHVDMIVYSYTYATFNSHVCGDNHCLNLWICVYATSFSFVLKLVTLHLLCLLGCTCIIQAFPATDKPF